MGGAGSLRGHRCGDVRSLSCGFRGSGLWRGHAFVPLAPSTAKRWWAQRHDFNLFWFSFAPRPQRLGGCAQRARSLCPSASGPVAEGLGGHGQGPPRSHRMDLEPRPNRLKGAPPLRWRWSAQPRRLLRRTCSHSARCSPRCDHACSRHPSPLQLMQRGFPPSPMHVARAPWVPRSFVHTTLEPHPKCVAH